MNIEWQALEYEEKERSADWFWALGVIIVASSIASIIFSNYFFALLLVIGGSMLAYYAVKKPDMVNYILTEKGLKINTQFYPYKNIKSFWVHEDTREVLFIKIERFYMPIISMPIEAHKAEEIKELMLQNNIPEEEMKEHASEKIMETLGF